MSPVRLCGSTTLCMCFLLLVLMVHLRRLTPTAMASDTSSPPAAAAGNHVDGTFSTMVTTGSQVQWQGCRLKDTPHTHTSEIFYVMRNVQIIDFLKLKHWLHCVFERNRLNACLNYLLASPELHRLTHSFKPSSV